MAQIKRKKVSRAAVKGQKRENTLLKNKKFWIIVSSIVGGLAILGVAIWLIVFFATQSNTKENPDFFGKSTQYVDVYKDKTNNTEVEFTKMSYDGLCMHTLDYPGNEKVYVEHVFVFAANLSTFYVDDTINTGKSTDAEDYVKADTIKNYKDLYAQLAFLQYSINEYNKDSNAKVALYIIDTASADNTGLMTDLKYGGSEDNSSGVVFFLYSYGELIKFADEDEQKSIFCTTVSEITYTGINYACNLMNNDFQLEENKQ